MFPDCLGLRNNVPLGSRAVSRMLLSVAVLIVVLAGPAGAQTPEFRAFWADVFHEGFKSAAQIDAMVGRAVAGNYNAILAEVMGFQDAAAASHGAYWNSSILPKAPDIEVGLDPLAYLVQQAHASGIEVHCWLVAFRVSAAWPPAGNAFLSAHPEYLVVPQASMGTVAAVGSDYVLDPGSPDVQEYLVSIVRELVTNYAIDGIHWDYIRYTVADAGYPSNTSYANSSLARFKRITGYCSTPPSKACAAWDDFRRRGINELARRIRVEVPAITSNPRQPLRHTAALFCTGDASLFPVNSPAYNLFQDWSSWMEQGWLDAGCPMIYDREYKTSPNNEAQWYRDWVNAALGWRYNRHMYLGQANYLNTMTDSITQMQYAYGQGAHGTVNYSYYSTVDSNKDDTPENDWNWYPYIATNLFTSAVSPPTMPWRDPLTATEGTLYGRITDAGTGQPVDDATVQVAALPSVQTDGNGYYVVTMIPAGGSGTSYDVIARKPGYTPVTHSGVRVVAGEVRRDDTVLPPSGIAPPNITLDPQPQNAPAGGAATFTVTATGQDALTYQWMKNCVALRDGGHYSGVTTSTLTVSNVDPGNAANYRCAVANDGGTTYSNEAALTLQAPLGPDFLVESRSGGQNYANYSEVGTLSDSTSKSTATGTTAGIGSRWGYLNRNMYGVNKAIYSFAPPASGTYEVFVTWPTSTSASSSVEHIITHAYGSNSLIISQYGSSTSNKWNSLGQYILYSGATYTVTQTNENEVSDSGIFQADAVKWTLVSSSTDTIVVVVPNVRENAEAPSYTTNAENMRSQLIYAADQFAELPAGGAYLTRFRLRPDGATPALAQPDFSAFELTYSVSVTTRAPDNMSLVFAENYTPGRPVTVVRANAPWQAHTDNVGPAAGPKAFDIEFVLDEPYLYNPAEGNLLWDLAQLGTVWPINVDRLAISDKSKGGATAAMDRNATQAAGYSGVLVTEFTFALPEPLPGDLNRDLKVDGADVSIFAACATGPGIPYDPANPPEGCRSDQLTLADADGDSDVDLDDFGVLQRCYGSTAQQPAPDCGR